MQREFTIYDAAAARERPTTVSAPGAIAERCERGAKPRYAPNERAVKKESHDTSNITFE